jgi:hypothetical protein
LEAIDKFAALSSTLSGLIGGECFERLRAAVEDLDFKQGATMLREARSAESPKHG